jgi:hypothetical protein
MMKLATALLLAVSLLGGLSGCKKGASSSQDPNAEIRTAIQAHLAHKGNLNYNVKNGPGVMQLTYALEKRDGSWSVIESNPVGSNFSHPSLDGTQDPAAGGAKENVHNSISDMVRGLKSGGSAGGQNLPPGHPPVNKAPANGPK